MYTVYFMPRGECKSWNAEWNGIWNGIWNDKFSNKRELLMVFCIFFSVV